MTFLPIRFVLFFAFVLLAMSTEPLCTAGGAVCSTDVARWILWAVTAIMAAGVLVKLVIVVAASRTQYVSTTLMMLGAAQEKAIMPALACLALMATGYTLFAWIWAGITLLRYASIVIAEAHFNAN